MFNKIIVFSLILLVSISSCKKTVLEYNCDTINESGLEVVVDGNIEAKFSLETIQEYLDFSSCVGNCPDDDLECIMNCNTNLSSFPAGGAFSVACHITNTTKDPKSFTFNAGELFSPYSNSDQPMLCANEITITVKGKKSVTEAIPVFCLASGKSAPSSDSKYTYCNSIDSAGCLPDIIEILKTKNLSKISFTQAFEVQTIIWDCLDNSTVDLVYLNNLPNL